MLNISDYTHSPLYNNICQFNTFSITAYSKSNSGTKDENTHLKTLNFSERDLYVDDSILVSMMVSAMEAMSVFDHKVIHVDLKESTLSDFIEYDFSDDETSKVFDGSRFLVTLEPGNNYTSRNIQANFEADAPDNFFLEIARTSDGKEEYNKAMQQHSEAKKQWKDKDNELRERFIKDAIQEYIIKDESQKSDTHGAIFAFLTRRISIEPSNPKSLQSVIRVLERDRDGFKS